MNLNEFLCGPGGDALREQHDEEVERLQFSAAEALSAASCGAMAEVAALEIVAGLKWSRLAELRDEYTAANTSHDAALADVQLARRRAMHAEQRIRQQLILALEGEGNAAKRRLADAWHAHQQQEP